MSLPVLLGVLSIFFISLAIVGVVLYFYNKKIADNYLKIFKDSYIKGFSDKLITSFENQTKKGFTDNTAPVAINSPGVGDKNGNSKESEKLNALSILKTTGEILTDPMVLGSIGIDIVIREVVIKLAVKKILSNVMAKVSFNIASKFLKISSKILVKIGIKNGGRYLATVGIKAGEKAAENAAKIAEKKSVVEAQKLAAKASTTTTKTATKAVTTLGTRIAAKMTAAASTGPLAPIVAVALFAFDVLTFGLDVGDAGGYNKLETLQSYMEIRDGIEADFKQSFLNEGSSYPAVFGPVDKITLEEYTTSINTIVSDIMDISKNPVDPLMIPMITALIEDIKSGIITEDVIESENEDVLKKYNDLVNIDDVMKRATSQLCISKKGRIIDREDGEQSCSYPDRNSCESSYSWPLTETDTYAEFKDDKLGGACLVSSFALKTICSSVNLPYDTQTGVCKMDKNYCVSKGGDWGYNDKIKQNDCSIPHGQVMLELLLGTTITRGIKQVLDPNNYEQCKPGEYDSMYACHTCPDGTEMNRDLNTLVSTATIGSGGAALATTGALNMCYPKCKKGFHPFGCCICSPDCPEGYIDDGATCRKVECNPGDEKIGELCYPTCKSGFHKFGTQVCSPDCPEGWTDDGATCRKVECSSDQDTVGALCYDKCKSGFHPFGTNVCSPDCPAGFIDDGATCRKLECREGEEEKAGLCYPKCREGYNDSGLLCTKGCNGGYTDDGLLCRKPIETYGRGTGRIPNKKPCENGQRDDGTSCWEDLNIKSRWGGWNNTQLIFETTGCGCIKKTAFERYTCNADEELNGALCYPKCRDGYTADGCCICRKGGDVYAKESYGKGIGKVPNIKIDGKGPSYGRGAGSPQTKIIGKGPSYTVGSSVPKITIKTKEASYGRGGGQLSNTRIKQRSAAFSTKDN